MNSRPDISGRFSQPDARRRDQYGALCYGIERGKPRVLLITSRGTGRWVIPKGWPISGQDGAGTAAQEAWEEAGVRGRCHPRSIGTFHYDKVLSESESIPVLVEVFPLDVELVLDAYPESDQRRRQWFTPERAARHVNEPDLAALLRGFDPGTLH